jgi:hypothetical protein
VGEGATDLLLKKTEPFLRADCQVSLYNTSSVVGNVQIAKARYGNCPTDYAAPDVPRQGSVIFRKSCCQQGFTTYHVNTDNRKGMFETWLNK